MSEGWVEKEDEIKILGKTRKGARKDSFIRRNTKKVQGFFVLKLRIYKRGVGYRVLNEDEIQTAIDNIEEFHPNNEEWIVGQSREQWFLKNVLHRYMDQ